MSSNFGGWVPKPADKVVRHPRFEQLGPTHVELAPRRRRPFALTPPLILVYAFGTLVGIGTLLLELPFAHQGDGLAPFVDALFTATSAATVTGLVTQETSSYWTLPGQAVIMVLMFAGGLGIMTVVGAMLVFGGQRVPLRQRLVIRETIGTASFTDITGVLVRIVLWAVAIQIVGFVVLFVRFDSLYSTGDAVWHSLFQAVSGFNNAGFTSIPDSENLSSFQTDKLVGGTIAVLVVLGSLSYWVLGDVIERRRFSTLSLNTKLVLVTTGVLLLAGAFFFLLFESGAGGTVSHLPIADKIATSVFHSVNRTAGFSTVDFGETTQQTNLFYAALMFVGGASGSVAGGIKVNTLAIIAITAVATLRGRATVSAFNRRIPKAQIQWAQVIVIVSILGVFLLASMLTFIEQDFPFLDLLFEAASAFGTVGLSTGLTADLSSTSQFLLVLAMFLGRILPPMVIIVALSRDDREPLVRYPKEQLVIG